LGAGASGDAAAVRSLQRSDREVARLFVEMFRPIGEAVTVVSRLRRANSIDEAAVVAGFKCLGHGRNPLV
jgi:hypothetical protein